jgi:hypothetical protein
MRSNAIDRFLRDLWVAVTIWLTAFRYKHHICRVVKDGGPESTVWAHFLCEFKGLFSIVLLRFEDGSRDAYHSHAFHAVSWLLSGGLLESRTTRIAPGWIVYSYPPSALPIITLRSHHHKVTSVGRSWVLSFRGPWSSTWEETIPPAIPGDAPERRVLTNGRREVAARATGAAALLAVLGGCGPDMCKRWAGPPAQEDRRMCAEAVARGGGTYYGFEACMANLGYHEELYVCDSVRAGGAP